MLPESKPEPTFLLIQLSPGLPIALQLRAAASHYQQYVGHWPDLVRLNPKWNQYNDDIKELSIPIDYDTDIQYPTAWIGTAWINKGRIR